MPRDKKKESIKREGKYEYEINLLLTGMSINDVLSLSKTMGSDVSRRTLFRLKKEYCGYPTFDRG